MIKIESLDLLEIENSGLLNFNPEKFNDYLQHVLQDDERDLLNTHFEHHYLKFLNHFIFEKFDLLDNEFSKHPESVNTLQTKALRILNQMIQNKEIDFKFIFPFTESLDFESNQGLRILSKNLSKEIIHTFEILFFNIKNLKENQKFLSLNFFELKQILPEVVIFYSDFILKNKIETKYNNVLENLSPYLNFSKYEINPEIYRLLSLYYRRTNDPTKAESMMVQYRNHFEPDIEKRSKIHSHGNTQCFPPKATLESWGEILEECDQIQNEILIKTGIYRDTCEYFQCTDCCKYTFPVMTLTEYLHLKKWMEETNYPIKSIIEKSKKIQEDYKEQYGEELQIIDKNLPENHIRGIENPYNFRYTCPFLTNDGKCSCYKARPLICRGFGLSTDNNVSLKTCHYYLRQYQYNSSAENEREVYDMRQAQSLAKQSDKYITKQKSGQEQCLSGTIAAWFSSEDKL